MTNEMKWFVLGSTVFLVFVGMLMIHNESENSLTTEQKRSKEYFYCVRVKIINSGDITECDKIK